MRVPLLALACLFPGFSFAEAPLAVEQFTPELVAQEDLMFLTPAAQDLNAIDIAYLCFRNIQPRPGTELDTASMSLTDRVRPVFAQYGWPTDSSITNLGHLRPVGYQPCVDPGALLGARAGSFIFRHDYDHILSLNPGLGDLFDIYSVEGADLVAVSP